MVGQQNERQHTLTERETQIAMEVTNGLTSKEVAVKFGLSVHTVRNHRKNIMKKLGVKKSAAWMLRVHPIETSSAQLQKPR